MPTTITITGPHAVDLTNEVEEFIRAAGGEPAVEGTTITVHFPQRVRPFARARHCREELEVEDW